MTTKKTPNNPKINKPKNTSVKPLIAIIIISLIIALLLPYLKEGQKFIDSDVALNVLEKKFEE